MEEMIDQPSPKEKTDKYFYECVNNGWNFDEFVEHKLQERTRQIFDDCLRECNDKKSYDRILELKQKRESQ